MRGSVVERVPDKNEVHGSIPCAPTNKERFLDSPALRGHVENSNFRHKKEVEGSIPSPPTNIALDMSKVFEASSFKVLSS